MSLKSKIEAVIYASEEPVTLLQLTGLLGEEAQAELDAVAADQALLPLDGKAELEAEAGAASATDPDDAEPGMDDDETPETGSNSHQLTESQAQPETLTAEPSEADKRRARERERLVREHIRRAVDRLIRDYADNDHGIEIREVASGFRMGTKPEYHDAVRGFVKGLKPALKLTLQALETLAVVAYKQPVTAAEISEIRGVDSAGVLGGLMARKLIATAGRKQVIGRPMLYKTTRDFLLRFGLKDVQELPSMEEFERLAGELAEQDDLPMDHADVLIEQANARGDAEHISDSNALAGYAASQQESAVNTPETNEKATAEIAAGGNHEQDIHSIQHRSAEAETVHPTQDGEHGPAAQTGSEASEHRGNPGNDGEESEQTGQG